MSMRRTVSRCGFGSGVARCRWRAAVGAVTGAALVLALAPSSASADHARRDVRIEPATRYSSTQRWAKGSGGDTGGNGFWYQTVRSAGTPDAYAVWSMGNLRGDYELEVFVPRSGANPAPTAEAIYRVEEHRGNKWVTVVRVWVDQSSQRGWRRTLVSFTLDGPVRVVADVDDATTGRRSTAVLAVDTAKLKWVMPHPVDRDIEADHCVSLFEDEKPDPGQVASALIRPRLPRGPRGGVPNVLPGQETNWQKCQRLRDGETIWVEPTLFSVPWLPGTGLTDQHDSHGRAVPGRSITRWW